MKYLKSFNESLFLSNSQICDIEDILLDVKDIGFDVKVDHLKHNRMSNRFQIVIQKIDGQRVNWEDISEDIERIFDYLKGFRITDISIAVNGNPISQYTGSGYLDMGPENIDPLYRIENIDITFTNKTND